MEGRDRRKPSFSLSPHVAKRCKSDDDRRSWVNKRYTPMAADSRNFEKSCTPVRFMFYEQGKWHDFSQDVSASLVAAFQARHSSVKFSIHGIRYLLCFIRMVQLNRITGFCRSIAWIDVSCRTFSPLRWIEGHLGKKCSDNHDSARPGIISIPTLLREDAIEANPLLTCQKSPLDVDASQRSTKSNNVQLAESSPSTFLSHGCCHKVESSDTTATVDSSSSISDVTSSFYDAHDHDYGLLGLQNFPLLQDKLMTLKDTEPEFDEVKTRFMAGLCELADHTTITSISKDCHWSPSGRVRHQAFIQQEEVTKRIRGDANVRYAWYGASKEGVSSLVLHGFGRPKTPKDGAMYGVGIYLAPEKYANLSAILSDVDKNGERYMVLCRVIMGRMEQICRGSVQFHPSGEDFDGGVDDMCNPLYYVVWSTHMNTHILPEYIISYKLSTTWQGIAARMRRMRKVRGKPLQFEYGHTGPVKVKGDSCAEPVSKCFYSPPKSPWNSIEMLFLLLKSNLSPERMDALQQHYLELKDGRLSSSNFIMNVRVIAGDDLVGRCMNSMQMHFLGAALLRNSFASGSYQMAGSNRVA